MSDKCHHQIQNTPRFFWRGAVAFLASVSMAAFAMDIFICIRLMIEGFESATGNSLATKINHLLMMSEITYVIEWIWAFIFSIIPFLFGFRIAQRKNLFTLQFFVKGAIVTGVLLSPIAAIMPNFGINVQEDIGDYVIHQFMFFLPCFTVSGAIAGLVCWIFLKPRVKTLPMS